MPKPCYFEIPVNDMNRAQKFYSDLFGWKFIKLENCPDNIDYYNIETGPEDEVGMPFGGIMKRQVPEHSFTPYINVDKIETYIDKIKGLGATEVMPKTPVPGKGWFAIYVDPENNPVGLWQCDESAN